MTRSNNLIIHCPSKPQSMVHAKMCATFFCKLRGLMFVRSLDPADGLLLAEASEGRVGTAIHMLFMAMDITAVWINAGGVVVDVRHARRWQPILVPKAPARYVLEAHASRISDFAVGDQLIFENAPL
jgi:uncharacterized membrane protein (UPF0127 family)